MTQVKIPSKELNDGRRMPLLGLGTFVGFRPKYEMNAAEIPKIKAAIEYAIQVGYRHIDTAAFYRVEPQVGECVQEAIKSGIVTREEMFITTKLWNDMHKFEDVEPALRGSLKKLKMDYVDLYLIHWPCAFDAAAKIQDIDYLETWRGMERVKELGLAKSIGVSNFNIEQLQRLLKYCTVRPAVNQVEVNLNLQQYDLVDFCRKENIAVTAYTPFGSVLGNKKCHDYFKTGIKPTTLDAAVLVEIANKHKKKPTQILLKPLVQQDIIAIPKTATLPRILENASIFDFELSADDMTKLRSFDNGYRTVYPLQFQKHPHYPFKKTNIDIIEKNVYITEIELKEVEHFVACKL